MEEVDDIRRALHGPYYPRQQRRLFGLKAAVVIFQSHTEHHLVAFTLERKRPLSMAPHRRLEPEFLAEYGSLSTVV